MLISEIYVSRQGEGRFTGTPSVFVRTSGCNLRCVFCDTPYTSWEPTGQTHSIDEIFSEINAVADETTHVVITGGEPMLSRKIVPLCEKIKANGLHITIETAGTIYRGPACDLMSISPKLSNSDPPESRAGGWRKRHQSDRHRPDIVRRLVQEYDYQLKFVVKSPDDIAEIQDYLVQLGPIDSSCVMLMPEGVQQQQLVQRSQWLGPLCEDLGFTLCARRHIEWYGNTRGT